MNPRVLTLFALLLFAVPALATDIDFFAGLKEAEPAPGQTVRLLGIYPWTLPEGLENFRILAPNEAPTTRHGALLGHVILEDGGWLQETLIQGGEAMVMPVFEEDATRLDFLKGIEDEARRARKGLWGARPVVCAAFAKGAFDSFSLVQGRVLDAANVRGTIYLNFGVEWREDFTIKIKRAVFNALPEALQAELTRLTAMEKPDSVVEARGWVFFSGGPMIEVKVPAQFEILGPGSDKIIEGCAS